MSNGVQTLLGLSSRKGRWVDHTHDRHETRKPLAFATELANGAGRIGTDNTLAAPNGRPYAGCRRAAKLRGHVGAIYGIYPATARRRRFRLKWTAVAQMARPEAGGAHDHGTASSAYGTDGVSPKGRSASRRTARTVEQPAGHHTEAPTMPAMVRYARRTDQVNAAGGSTARGRPPDCEHDPLRPVPTRTST